MTDDPGTREPPPEGDTRDAVAARRRATAVAGHRRDVATARQGLSSEDPRVRELALSALARADALDEPTVLTALEDAVPAVRRRAADLAVRVAVSGSTGSTGSSDSAVPAGSSVPAGSVGPTAPQGVMVAALRQALADQDALVVEAACWSLGELADAGAVATLSGMARVHEDARVREAALAALATIGDPEGLEAVLDALGDRPTVRRRAVVALSAFDGPEVEDALRRSAADRDWQVREVAEILLDEEDGDGEPGAGRPPAP